MKNYRVLSLCDLFAFYVSKSPGYLLFIFVRTGDYSGGEFRDLTLTKPFPTYIVQEIIFGPSIVGSWLSSSHIDQFDFEHYSNQ